MSLFELATKTHWAMEPEAYKQLLSFLERDFNAVDLAKAMHLDYEKYIGADGLPKPFAIEKMYGEDLPGSRYATVRDNIALIPITGPIVPRASLMTLSGSQSVSALAKDFTLSMENEAIDTIIFNVDSPGGNIVGISEFANMINAACNGDKKKKVISYVYGNGASGAYWIIAATQEIVVADTAMVGSLGVVSAETNRQKADEKSGIQTIEIVSSQSPKKRISAFTEEGRAHKQEIVNQLADVFLSSVARFRNTSLENVLDNYGQGGMVVAQKAVESKMADRMGCLEQLIDENKQTQKTFSFGGSYMITYAQVKETPAVFEQILNEGKALGIAEASKGTEEKIAAARKEGATAENARMQAIDKLNVPGAEAVIKEHKYNMDMTAEKVSLKILEAQQQTREKQAENLAKDKNAFTASVAGLGKAQSVDAAAAVDGSDEAAVTEAMVNGANTKTRKFPFGDK